MGSFSQRQLWTHTWGFTAHCVEVTTPTDGTNTICVSRFQAAFLVLQHCYTILYENTPTAFGVPVLVIIFVACITALVGGCLWEAYGAVGTDDGGVLQDCHLTSSSHRKSGVSAAKAD
jgi:hypothetical protein